MNGAEMVVGETVAGARHPQRADPGTIHADESPARLTMPRFFLTVITGLEDPAAEAIQADVRDADIERVGEGFVLFRSEADAERLRGLRFANNVFVVLSLHDNVGGAEPLKALGAAVRDDASLDEALSEACPRGGSFTILASVENQPAAIPHFTLEKLERYIQAAGRFTPDRQNPSLRFWLIARRDGLGMLALRLTRGEPAGEPGSLRPELCNLLCRMARPHPEDVFLDPFCGSGAIALERAAAFPCREVLAGDRDAALVGELAAKARKRKLPMHVTELDALTLGGIPDASVTSIVTDPPWGKFDGSPAVDPEAMLRSFGRVLKPWGRAVILLSRDIELPAKGLAEAGFAEEACFLPLVSGQKAAVHVLTRR
jgi:SAM-dependent methyltransferase